MENVKASASEQTNRKKNIKPLSYVVKKAVMEVYFTSEMTELVEVTMVSRYALTRCPTVKASTCFLTKEFHSPATR